MVNSQKVTSLLLGSWCSLALVYCGKISLNAQKMDTASSKDNATHCGCQKGITEPESKCVPEARPHIRCATNTVQYNSSEAYVPMHCSAGHLSTFEKANKTDEQEVEICTRQASRLSKRVSLQPDCPYEQISICKAWKSTEIGYSIAELLENETLPQVLHVTHGHTGSSEQESLIEGDVVLSHCLIAREVVIAESRTGVHFTVPLKSHHKFFLVQDNVNTFADVWKVCSQFAHCSTATDLAKLPQLPRVVKVTSASKGKTPYESVEKGMLLLLQAVAERDGKIALVAKDLNGDERCLSEKCKGGFELRPRDTWLHIEEIVQHSPLPTKVFLANHQMIADSNTGDPALLDEHCTLQCQPFTLLHKTKQTYLVVSKHNKSIDSAFTSELVLEVPTTLNIRLKCIPLTDKKQEKSLLQVAKKVYEHIQLCPGQLVLDNSLAMTEAEHKLQELLYLTTFSQDTVEQIRLMAGGKPKVRLPASALPAARKKLKKKSQGFGLMEQDVEGTITQIKTDIRNLEAMLTECKDRLHRLEMNLQAGDANNS